MNFTSFLKSQKFKETIWHIVSRNHKNEESLEITWILFNDDIHFRYDTEEELYHINAEFPKETNSSDNLMLAIESGLYEALKSILQELKAEHPDTGYWVRIDHPDLGNNTFSSSCTQILCEDSFR